MGTAATAGDPERRHDHEHAHEHDTSTTRGEHADMRITVMGMGNMGRAIATRLCRTGHDVVVWNRTPGRANEVLDVGATEAGTVAAAADGAEAVVLSLADDDAVLDLLFGSPSLSTVLGDAVLVDSSTVAPATSRREAAEVPGGAMVASPVLGAPRAVADGSASYLVAGPRTSIERLAPMWDALSASWRVLGDDPGTATTWKVLSNTLLMAGVSVVAEVVATAQRAGIADELLTDLLTTSPMVAPGLHNRIANIVGDTHDGWFSGRLGAKDLRLTEELAAGCGLTLPVTASVRRRYEAMTDAGIDGDDIAAVVELARRS
jgi:3-hydroxyisobutyrate dehydrogenase-like beta-hydroxyacid dehydrogenase